MNRCDWEPVWGPSFAEGLHRSFCRCRADMGMFMTICASAQVIEALRDIRCRAASTEGELHRQAALAFARAGLPACHEAQLAPHCRIDFLVGGVGVEVKKSRPAPAALGRQLARYAACEQVRELVVIAPRGVDLPRTIGGKPVTMLSLQRLWGIALP